MSFTVVWGLGLQARRFDNQQEASLASGGQGVANGIVDDRWPAYVCEFAVDRVVLS